MVEPKDVRVGIAVYNDAGEILVLDESVISALFDPYDPELLKDLHPIAITKEILRDKFGFVIHDMGDFWQCELEDFILIQAKFIIDPSKEMPYVYGFKSQTGTTKIFNFVHVHHLQNFYFFTQKSELIWTEIA